ncbi:MAG TPA: septum formation initiator family protein [Deltaproteobacteria bacterium]|nr:septum formation initiator family protein [Deltaproteobacteria bacterium]
MKRRSSSPRGRRSYLTAAFCALIVVIVALAVFGDKGLLDVLRLMDEKERIEAGNRELAAENERLAREIRLLKEDRRYIETVARGELGMVGRGELIYLFDDGERR